MQDSVRRGSFSSTGSVRSASHQAPTELWKRQYFNEAVIEANQKRAIINYFK